MRVMGVDDGQGAPINNAIVQKREAGNWVQAEAGGISTQQGCHAGRQRRGVTNQLQCWDKWRASKIRKA